MTAWPNEIIECNSANRKPIWSTNFSRDVHQVVIKVCWVQKVVYAQKQKLVKTNPNQDQTLINMQYLYKNSINDIS